MTSLNAALGAHVQRAAWPRAVASDMIDSSIVQMIAAVVRNSLATPGGIP
jgi:hypothetical protein